MKPEKRDRLEKVFNVTAVGILVASLAAAGFWLFSPDSFNLEPFLGFLGLLYTMVPLFGRWLMKRFSTDLERERVTLSYALAYGYLTNYLAPVVKRLRNDSGSPDDLRFFVYIPDKLEELQRDLIEDFLNELGNKNYVIDKVELEFGEQKRARDVRTAKKLSDGSSLKYFDFPTTLLTTVPAIDFKLDPSEGRSFKEQKAILAEDYIREFRTQLEKMLATDDFATIRRNIVLGHGGLNFLESGLSDS